MWDLSRLDREERIVAGESLIPDLPHLKVDGIDSLLLIDAAAGIAVQQASTARLGKISMTFGRAASSTLTLGRAGLPETFSTTPPRSAPR